MNTLSGPSSGRTERWITAPLMRREHHDITSSETMGDGCGAMGTGDGLTEVDSGGWVTLNIVNGKWEMTMANCKCQV